MFLSLWWLFVAVAYKAEGRVEKDFTNCSEVFFNSQAPVGFQGIAKPHAFKEIPDGIKDISDLDSPASICQTLGGKSYFATLYDRGRRIPLYSAYILDRKDTNPNEGCKRTQQFKLEPQLVYRGLTEDMQTFENAKNSIKVYNQDNGISERIPKNRQTTLLSESQALDSDYKSDTYTRGHVNPCGHHSNQDNYLSTFTFTNAVPMVAELNNDVWSKYEDEMIAIASNCKKMYVVTGSVPGNNVLNGRMTIPSYVWNAYCCVDNLGKPKSGGAIAANDKAVMKNNKFEVEKMTLRDLQVRLKNLLGGRNDIEIFKCN